MSEKSVKDDGAPVSGDSASEPIANEAAADQAGAAKATSQEPERRRFLTTLTKVAMAGGLVAGYGTCGAFAGRFLYPARDRLTGWQFVIKAGDVPLGAAVEYIAPDGAPVNIARRDQKGGVEDFIALSSTCPHLGCRVHWQAQQNRFFCPCHNGVFTPEGKAIAGPPAEAGQSLSRYPLELDQGLLYVEVPLESLTVAAAADNLDDLDDLALDGRDGSGLGSKKRRS
jgi:Rieske Fe-S protein